MWVIQYLLLACLLFIAVFLLMNWYINFHRKEDLPANNFLSYLKCEFIIGVHWFPYDPDSDYKVCYRCDAVRGRYEETENA